MSKTARGRHSDRKMCYMVLRYNLQAMETGLRLDSYLANLSLVKQHFILLAKLCMYMKMQIVSLGILKGETKN